MRPRRLSSIEQVMIRHYLVNDITLLNTPLIIAVMRKQTIVNLLFLYVGKFFEFSKSFFYIINSFFVIFSLCFCKTIEPILIFCLMELFCAIILMSIVILFLVHLLLLRLALVGADKCLVIIRSKKQLAAYLAIAEILLMFIYDFQIMDDKRKQCEIRSRTSGSGCPHPRGG